MKEFLEEALEGELEAHIDQEEDPNRKNGKGKKKVETYPYDQVRPGSLKN